MEKICVCKKWSRSSTFQTYRVDTVLRFSREVLSAVKQLQSVLQSESLFNNVLLTQSKWQFFCQWIVGVLRESFSAYVRRQWSVSLNSPWWVFPHTHDPLWLSVWTGLRMRFYWNIPDPRHRHRASWKWKWVTQGKVAVWGRRRDVFRAEERSRSDSESANTSLL